VDPLARHPSTLGLGPPKATRVPTVPNPLETTFLTVRPGRTFQPTPISDPFSRAMDTSSDTSSIDPSSTATILVVDDVAAVRHLARRALEVAGYRVLEAGDGIEALDCLIRSPVVDLVITDVRMPNMDGWELAARLAGRSPRVPVLFMSGYDEHLGSQSLLGPILAKPFSSEQLFERIRQVLGSSQDARAGGEADRAS
jgi:CheY-like chemotaxis protein